MTLSTPVTELGNIGEKTTDKLRRLGITTVGDLVEHYPHRYEDFSHTKDVIDLQEGEKATVTVKIIGSKTKRTWKKRLRITEIHAQDNTGLVRAVWFNQPYLARTLQEGFWVHLSGTVKKDAKGPHFANPHFEVIGKKRQQKDTLHTGGLVPIYPETRGLTSRFLRGKIHRALKQLESFSDFLPEDLIAQHNLPDRNTAMRQIHFPKNQKQVDVARRRLAFEELFLLQLSAKLERARIKSEPAPAIPTNVPLIKEFIENLSFNLTDSQRVAAWQILKDIERPSPMNRLLEGDVGSGKTVVAAIAALNVADAGWQTGWLAPTEILARQHFATATRMLENTPYHVALLTASDARTNKLDYEDRRYLIEDIAEGDINIVIGTHALIQKHVQFRKLGLVIIDEQHRFGVEQRAKLIKDSKKQGKDETIIHNSKYIIPHFLSMTATPIPRTLALTLYGDLDLSVLKELPAGRKKIQTRFVPPAKRPQAYQFIREQIEKGHQAFVVCPLIEDSEKLEARSVEKEYEKLSEDIFPDLRIGVLHGKMRAQDKQEIMQQMQEGDIDILISTSVVEVGIDVPNATVMMIEGAERFGLAQLHQFRGRVGRAEHQSYCFLFTDSAGTATQERLQAMVDSSSGFELAERDLQLRGPGEFFGTKQSGIPDLAMASLTDSALIEETQQAVQHFMQHEKLANHPQLKKALAQFKKEVHWE